MAFDWWGPEFEKRSDGRYKVELYPANSLIASSAALDSVKSGVAEIVVTSTTQFPLDFPLATAPTLPTLGFPVDTYEQTITCWDAGDEFYNTFPEVQAEFKDFKNLFVFGITVSHLLTKSKEVHFPSDLNGMRIGASGSVSEIVTANGGAAVQQIPPEAYQNMQKGLVDGGFHSYMQIADHKLYEVAKYLYDENFGQGAMIVMMNWNAWNAMSPADQKLVVDTWADARDLAAHYLVDAQAEAIDTPEFRQLKLNEPTQEESAAWQKSAEETVIKSWKNTATGLNIDPAVVDKVLAGWKDIHAKYMKKLQ
jgi:TRAP-type C4-dicarboxylate transport system substrate-binding protein